MDTPADVKLLVVATNSQGYMPALLESSLKFAYDLTVRGMGEVWTGWDWRMRHVRQFANEQDPDQWMMWVDAFDVVLTRRITVGDVSRLPHDKVTFGGTRTQSIWDRICAERFSGIVQDRLQFYGGLCCGTVIGKAGLIMALIDSMDLDDPKFDDQESFIKLQGTGLVRIDGRRELFVTPFGHPLTRKLDLAGNELALLPGARLFSTSTNTFPVAIHGINDAQLEPVLFALGLPSWLVNHKTVYGLKKSAYHIRRAIMKSPTLQRIIVRVVLLIVILVLIIIWVVRRRKHKRKIMMSNTEI